MPQHGLIIKGLAELASDLPDGRWYELRVRLRRSAAGAEIIVLPDVLPIENQADPRGR